MYQLSTVITFLVKDFLLTLIVVDVSNTKRPNSYSRIRSFDKFNVTKGLFAPFEAIIYN